MWPIFPVYRRRRILTNDAQRPCSYTAQWPKNVSENQPRIIVLDRDGVINEESDEYIKSPAEWIPLPGSLDAIAALTHAGFRIAIATNQSGVGRGLYTVEMLEAIHEKMIASIHAAGGKIDAIFFCPHLPSDNCRLSQTETRSVAQVAKLFGCAPASMQIIGDSIRDLQAAQSVGAQSILVRTGYGQGNQRNYCRAIALFRFSTISLTLPVH